MRIRRLFAIGGTLLLVTGCASKPVLEPVPSTTSSSTSSTSSTSATPSTTETHNPNAFTQAKLKKSNDAIEAGTDFLKAHKFGIATNVYEGDTKIQATTGLADVTKKTSMPSNAQFRIGSVTKTFTAAVLLQLEAEGKVSINDSVQKWFPGLLNSNGFDGSKITIKQLLNHTSGLVDFINIEGIDSNTMTHEQVVQAAQAQGPLGAPGKVWEYSNTNYTLVAMIIEKASGDSWQNQIKKRIIDPLHLSKTYIPVGSDENVPTGTPQGYSVSLDGSVINDTKQDMRWAWGLGDIISTQDDVNTFFQALVQGKLIPQKQWKEMSQNMVSTVDYTWASKYGLGLMSNVSSCGKQYYTHSGSVLGYQTRVAITADGKRSFVSYYNAFNWVDNRLSTPKYHDAISAAFCAPSIEK
ncbi:MAG: serine hydrolase domain-containing protein [Micrococcaceae bacterium]